ncbi:hypothetical protein L915_03783, partial [Phytophthora nicotianae]
RTTGKSTKAARYCKLSSTATIPYVISSARKKSRDGGHMVGVLTDRRSII